MIQKKGICSKCGCNTNIVNSKYWLCFRCNSQRRFIDKQKQNRDGGLQPYMEFYKEIWNERTHKCELTDAPLNFAVGSDMWRTCFSHIFAKGKFPKWSRVKLNIILVHPDIHHLIDNGTKEKLINAIGIEGVDELNKRKKEILNIK